MQGLSHLLHKGSASRFGLANQHTYRRASNAYSILHKLDQLTVPKWFLRLASAGLSDLPDPSLIAARQRQIQHQVCLKQGLPPDCQLISWAPYHAQPGSTVRVQRMHLHRRGVLVILPDSKYAQLSAALQCHGCRITHAIEKIKLFHT